MSAWKGSGETFKRGKHGSGSNIPPESSALVGAVAVSVGVHSHPHKAPLCRAGKTFTLLHFQVNCTITASLLTQCAITTESWCFSMFDDPGTAALWCFLGMINSMWQSHWCFCIDSFKENTETTCNCLLFSCQSSMIIFFTNQREPSINLLLCKLPVDNLDLCYGNWMKQNTFLGLLNRSECSQKCLKSAHQGGVMKDSAQTLPGKFRSFQKQVLPSETCFRGAPLGSCWTGNCLNHGLKNLKIFHLRSWFVTMSVTKENSPQNDYCFEILLFMVCFCWFFKKTSFQMFLLRSILR